MKSITYLIISVSCFMVACNGPAEQPPVVESVEALNPSRFAVTAEATINATSLSGVAGTVKFVEDAGVVTMTVNITNANPGSHAIHIHEFGDCSATDGKSAGGHWNPTQENHGKWGIIPFHIGDIGNIEIGEDRRGELTLETDKWCLSCKDLSKNILGKAIIMHEGPDDFSSQPAGAAGARIGCGEIIFTESVVPNQ